MLATVFAGPAGQLGQRLLVTAAGTVRCGAGLDETLARQLGPAARQALAAGRSATGTCEGLGRAACQVFFEWLAPAPRLTVYGAGNDARPLVRLAAELGWRVRVVDGRPALATAARFPEAEQVSVVPLEQLASRPVTDSWAVLMTHNYPYELAVLRQLLPAAVSYIGVLGPRQKAARLVADLQAEGWPVDERLGSRLHSPVGLSLGAETPNEVALSIAAELLAVRTGQAGGPLRDAPGPIHARLAGVAAVGELVS